jgi:endonuclease/exonuclease/phosphatase (EEP) superfamily protein YafD
MTDRRLSAILVVIATLTLAALVWPQAVGLARAPIAAQVVSLRGLAATVSLGAALVLLVVALAARRFRWLWAGLAIALLLFTVANVAILASRGLESRALPDDGLTVLTWNTLGDAPGAEVIAQLAIETGAEVVSLPETTAQTGARIAALMSGAGMPVSVHSVTYDESNPARSTTLLISAALGQYDTRVGHTTLMLPSVVAEPRDGTGPTIIAVHTLAPIPPMMLAWQNDLEWVAEACTGDALVAGDFNATLDHFAGIAHAKGATLGDCLDAAAATGGAAAGTWPVSLPAALGAPIDHVLATPNWRPAGARVIETHDDFGSDHRPVLAQFVSAD